MPATGTAAAPAVRTRTSCDDAHHGRDAHDEGTTMTTPPTGHQHELRLEADGRVVTAYDVAPAGWWFGGTYTSNAQFY